MRNIMLPWLRPEATGDRYSAVSDRGRCRIGERAMKISEIKAHTLRPLDFEFRYKETWDPMIVQPVLLRTTPQFTRSTAKPGPNDGLSAGETSAGYPSDNW
jgi:hypothetical protein